MSISYGIQCSVQAYTYNFIANASDADELAQKLSINLQRIDDTLPPQCVAKDKIIDIGIMPTDTEDGRRPRDETTETFLDILEVTTEQAAIWDNNEQKYVFPDLRVTMSCLYFGYTHTQRVDGYHIENQWFQVTIKWAY